MFAKLFMPSPLTTPSTIPVEPGIGWLPDSGTNTDVCGVGDGL